MNKEERTKLIRRLNRMKYKYMGRGLLYELEVMIDELIEDIEEENL